MKNSIPNAAKISPTDFVIFGGGGDLSIRKIIPALFWRFVDKQIDSCLLYTYPSPRDS